MKDKYPAKQSRQSKPKYILDDPEYIMAMRNLQKEYNMWYSSGQYLLADEANRRIQCILSGNKSGYYKQVHSEHLAIKTNRMLTSEERKTYVYPTYNKIYAN